MLSADLEFRRSWRPYQERILGALNRDLLDNKLHLVAAPGSGKTILGLEIFRRLGKPALALSPTRTIRDQWISRLKDFVREEAPWPPRWTSTDLWKPGEFTSVTYQALHTNYRRDQEAIPEDHEDGEVEEADSLDEALDQTEIAAITDVLKRAGVGTLILDEAHHLRAEWWKALTALAAGLPSLTIVSLTATPPYDVIGPEWNRYQELCGPIDEEISVPELVRSGTLCPHQDFVWTVVPLKNERDLVEQYDRAVESEGAALLVDEVFERIVAAHPWLTAEDPDDQAVLDAPEAAIALVVFLKTKGRPLPANLMKLLDLDPDDVPAMDRRWWQALVKTYLFDKEWRLGEEEQRHRNELAARLRANHLLWRTELRLDKSRLVKSRLTLSSAKIDACVDIHEAEREQRGDALRQVILTDFIRDRDTRGPASGVPPPLGALPVFRALVSRISSDSAKDVALLTGRLIVVHADVVPRLRAAMQRPDLVAVSVDSPRGFCRLEDPGASDVVAGITALLTQGVLRTVVGTRSLLGEGWDAPVVNSLVLASFVGSFMVTNQMRGRAIRTDKTCPDKVASVWHVVAVAPEFRSGFDDLAELASRFKTFVGLSEREASIESGINRMWLPYLDSRGHVPAMHPSSWSHNGYMINRLGRIADIAVRWKQAIEQGEAGHVAPTVKAVTLPRAGTIWFMKTLKYLLLQVLIAFSVAFLSLGQIALRASSDFLFVGLLIAALGATMYVLPRLYNAARIWLCHLPVDGTVRQIALAVRDSLCQADLILGSASRFPVATIKHEDGSVSICLSDGTFLERSLFADCINEILGPIGNPRYLLTRYKAEQTLGQRDYHAVPQSLGVKKTYAEALRDAWERRVGPTELLYVRGSEGRKELLRARARAFSTAMQKAAERFDRWQ